jgi:hypothetical protein
MLTWVIVSLLWILCAFAAGYMAGNKDRSVWTWFLLGIPFGLFALIAISALEKKAPPSWTCPNCKRVNALTSNFCGDCGHAQVRPQTDEKGT